MLTLETSGAILFPLNYLVAIRTTGKSKHFDCCSVILKFNVEGKKINKLE